MLNGNGERIQLVVDKIAEDLRIGSIVEFPDLLKLHFSRLKTRPAEQSSWGAWLCMNIQNNAATFQQW
jgi:hypothetical protein